MTDPTYPPCYHTGAAINAAARAENGCAQCIFDLDCTKHDRQGDATPVGIEDRDSVYATEPDAALVEENERLQQQVNDLLSGAYTTCVFCGHRYGPGDAKVPTSALIYHMLECPQHPLAHVAKVIGKYQGLLRPEDDLENLRTKEEGWDKLVDHLKRIREYALACEVQEQHKPDLLDGVISSLMADPEYRDDLEGLTHEERRVHVAQVLREHL